MRYKKQMTFGDLIIRFLIVLAFMGFIQFVLPLMTGSPCQNWFSVFLMMIVAGYAFYLRIQWDRKIIHYVKEKYKKSKGYDNF